MTPTPDPQESLLEAAQEMGFLTITLITESEQQS